MMIIEIFATNVSDYNVIVLKLFMSLNGSTKLIGPCSDSSLKICVVVWYLALRIITEHIGSEIPSDDLPERQFPIEISNGR